MRKGSGSIKGKVKSLTNSSYYDEYECDSLWALNRTVAGMLGGYMDTLSRCRGQTAGAVCGDGGVSTTDTRINPPPALLLTTVLHTLHALCLALWLHLRTRLVNSS